MGNARTVEDAVAIVPVHCGLYAIYGPAAVWRELRLGEPPDKRPLYVGKAERSLAGRDVRDHFGFVMPNRRASVTGSSTLRRSLAALLHEPRRFRGVPRNAYKPGHFANYGLTEEQDNLLSDWMRERLRLAVWPRPTGCTARLRDIEGGVLREVLPPLNLDGAVTPWTQYVRAARAVLCAEARAAATS